MYKFFRCGIFWTLLTSLFLTLKLCRRSWRLIDQPNKYWCIRYLFMFVFKVFKKIKVNQGVYVCIFSSFMLRTRWLCAAMWPAKRFALKDEALRSVCCHSEAIATRSRRVAVLTREKSALISQTFYYRNEMNYSNAKSWGCAQTFADIIVFSLAHTVQCRIEYSVRVHVHCVWQLFLGPGGRWCKLEWIKLRILSSLFPYLG